LAFSAELFSKHTNVSPADRLGVLDGPLNKLVREHLLAQAQVVVDGGHLSSGGEHRRGRLLGEARAQSQAGRRELGVGRAEELDAAVAADAVQKLARTTVPIVIGSAGSMRDCAITACSLLSARSGRLAREVDKAALGEHLVDRRLATCEAGHGLAVAAARELTLVTAAGLLAVT
jgi:hypothetical protein